jgi:hypothetical protein
MCKNHDNKKFNPADPFADIADLEDAREWSGDPQDIVDVHKDLNRATVARYEEPCFKCRGSGNWRPGYPCFKCKGSGKLYYKTSPEVRAEQKRRRVEKQKADALAKFEAGAAWLEANADVAAYLKEEAAKENQWAQFPRDMLAAIYKFGALTPGQEAAVRKGMARKAAWAEKNKAESAARDARTADASLDFAPLLEKFNNALNAGKRSPTLHVGNLRIEMAKPHSKNPGCLYVTTNESYEDRTYLGKITPAGEFFAARACTDELFEEVKILNGDTLAAAVAHGKETGRCSCCNRELTNELSVELGIGPICRAKWGL